MPPGRPKSFCTEDALERALAVFWTKGFESTSIADLVDATGVGRQSLYDTFGDKRRLYLAALDKYATTQFKGVTDILEGPPPKGDRIREVLHLWAERNQSPSCRGCLMANSFAEFGKDDPELSATLRRHMTTLESAFARALTQAAQEGSVRRDIDPEALARVLVNAGQGMSLAGKGGLGADRFPDIVETLERLIV